MDGENICETTPGSNDQDKHEDNYASDDAIPPSMAQAVNRCSGDERNRTNLHRISNNPECWSSNRESHQGINDHAIEQTNAYGGRILLKDVEETLEGINVLMSQLQNADHGSGGKMTHQRPKVMPDAFDGKIPWPQYLTHFETVGDLNGWNDHERAQYLAVSLCGEACQVIQLLEPRVRYNYRLLIEAMNRRFYPNHSESLYRTQLRTTVREPKQSLPALAQSIRALASQAYPSADNQLLDSLCCDHFIEALQDRDMKMQLISGNSDRFDDIVSQAIKYEAWSQAHRAETGKRFMYNVHADNSSKIEAECNQSKIDCNALQNECFRLSAELGILKGKLTQLQYQLNDLINKPDHKKQIKCYYCHVAGHIKPKCPKLAEKRNTSSGSRKTNSN